MRTYSSDDFRDVLLPVVLVAMLMASVAHARPNFVRTVPTPFSCDTCHDTPDMRQWRNGFGIDYATRRGIWATDADPGLCDLDSDGDGIRNGDELGDPNCEWRQGDRLPDVDATNPGETRDPDRCGDGVLHPGETCDGADFGDATCIDEGFIGGDLRCTAQCELDTRECQQPEPDAAPPEPDAAPPEPDAAPPEPDATLPPPDAAGLPADAAPVPADQGNPTPDADAPPADAGLPVTDDAASRTPDAMGAVDAEVSVRLDSGTNVTADPGDSAGDEGGCAQGASAHGAFGWVALFLWLGWRRRRT